MLLGGVTIGYFYAVEAAAMGAFALLVAGLVTGRLRAEALSKVLSDAIALTGALFALLLAATTFTWCCALLGTDRRSSAGSSPRSRAATSPPWPSCWR